MEGPSALGLLWAVILYGVPLIILIVFVWAVWDIRKSVAEIASELRKPKS